MNKLEIRDLEVCHGLLKAVRGINLNVQAGEVLAIVGANGAGKSTLMRAIAGSHRASQGSITFMGQTLGDLPAHKRVGLGLCLVPEGRRLFPKLTVQENLTVGAQIGRIGYWTVEKIFEVFDNLVKRRHANADTLSGGEQQATAIGRALVANPELVLLDEVSLGLSPAIVDRVYSILPQLRETETTVVLVEQDLGRVMKVSDRIICMLEGRIVLEGATKDLTRDQIIEAYFGLKPNAVEGAET
ncbi:ABC transporter ATP-binding protein [Shimia sp.]|uniref:ABC transporter ATP-binding protein n=1 Tax=Shimia sp. TaxID=1954381 RepID=UPI003297157A